MLLVGREGDPLAVPQSEAHRADRPLEGDGAEISSAADAPLRAMTS